MTLIASISVHIAFGGVADCYRDRLPASALRWRDTGCRRSYAGDCKAHGRLGATLPPVLQEPAAEATQAA